MSRKALNSVGDYPWLLVYWTFMRSQSEPWENVRHISKMHTALRV